MSTRPQRPVSAMSYANGDEMMIGALAVGVIEVVVLVAGAMLATLAFGHHHRLLSIPPSALAGSALGALTHASSPAIAWPKAVRAGLPGPVAYWATTAAVQVVVTVAIALAWRAWRVCRAVGGGWQRGRSGPGFANRTQVRRYLSARAVLARAPQVRPGLPKRGARAEDVGISLGRDGASGIALYGSLEDSYLVLGPPRSGKGVSLIIPGVIDAPGPAVVTSTRPDTLLHTICARREGGRPVEVFDPQGFAGWPSGLRWAPQRGCRDALTAILRAKGFAAGAGLDKSSVTNADYWQGQTAAVVRCYLHAADLDERPIRDVLAWTGHPGDPTPVDILRTHPDAAPGWAEELHAQIGSDPRTRDTIWSGVRRAFDCLADPRVLEACSPPLGVEFDAQAFLRANGTLYLVGSADAQLSISPLITALIEDLLSAGRNLAAHSPGGRLDPPLTLWLDEAANIAPLPSLPSLLSDGGGSGLPTVMVLQSLGQGRARWGQAAMEAMWDAATTKLVFGGLAHVEDLNRIARLAGELDEETISKSRGGVGRETRSTSIRRRPALSEDQVRSLPPGRVLVIHQRTPMVEAILDPWWRRPVAATVRGALAEAERETGRAQSAVSGGRRRKPTPAVETANSEAPPAPLGQQR